MSSKKNAFTLVELSVVIVIISIMLSTVLVSRSLIDSAKINKIKEEVNMFDSAINTFYTEYDCMPVDCNMNSVSRLATELTTAGCNTVSSATDETYNVFNTGGIQSATKRTCMMLSLKLAGYITGVAPTVGNLANAVVGVNVPRTSLGSNTAWDFNRVTGVGLGNIAVSEVTGRVPLPLELGVTGSTSNFIGNHALILRDSTTTTGITALATTTGTTPATTGGATYAMSSKLTQKLDSKFDDGIPYSGDIVGAVNLTDWNSSANTSCHNNNGLATIATTTASVSYATTNSVKSGCLVAFNIKTAQFI